MKTKLPQFQKLVLRPLSTIEKKRSILREKTKRRRVKIEKRGRKKSTKKTKMKKKNRTKRSVSRLWQNFGKIKS